MKFLKEIYNFHYMEDQVVLLEQRINKQLKKCGWNSYFKDEIYRLNPPILNLVDIIDAEKSNQYQNIIFNFTLYKYLNMLNQQNELEKYFLNIIEKNKIYF